MYINKIRLLPSLSFKLNKMKIDLVNLTYPDTIKLKLSLISFFFSRRRGLNPFFLYNEMILFWIDLDQLEITHTLITRVNSPNPKLRSKTWLGLITFFRIYFLFNHTKIKLARMGNSPNKI